MKMSIEERDKRLKHIDHCWSKRLLTYAEADDAKFDVYKEFYDGLEVGDGVTYHLWSDSKACTIIKRTPKMIVIQEDIAVLDPNFKPEFIIGGFCAHCTNQNEQSYTYERNPNGRTIRCHWSDVKGGFTYLGQRITAGRREFYDYNF